MFCDDFIMVVGWVSRRKLERLMAGPYQMALLKRGASKRMGEARKLILGQAMEYARAVGTMVFNQMVDNNNKTEEVFHWGQRGIYPVGIV